MQETRLSSWSFCWSPMRSDPSKLTTHRQLYCSSLWVLNMHESQSLTSLTLGIAGCDGKVAAPWPLSALVFFHSFRRLFKVITFSKRPLRKRRRNVLTFFDFLRFSSALLIHWWHGSPHMKPACAFQWTWGEHIYKLNPEPMAFVEKYLPSKALKWREHHLRYYIIH